MQGVSLGFHGWSRGWGDVQAPSGHRHHDDHARPIVADSSGNVTATDKLVGISTSITHLRSQLDSLTTIADTSPDMQAMSGVAGFDAKIISKQRGELQIHTQEGDVITLKFSNRVATEVTSLQASTDGVTQQATSVESHSRSRVSLQIEGDLNSEELAAVTDLVGKVGDLANQFYSGDVEAALAQATDLAYDTTQLADYSLDLRLKQSIRAYAQLVELPQPAPAPTTDALPAEESPVEVTPADVAPAVEPSAAAPAEVPVNAVTSGDVAETAATTEAPAASSGEAAATPVVSAPPATTTQTLSEFVTRVRSVFTAQAGDARLGFSYDFKVRLLVASIAASAPTNTAAEPATQEPAAAT